MTDAELIARTSLRLVNASSVYVLFKYGEILIKDALPYLGKSYPKGSAACVIGWPWSEEPHTLVLGVRDGGRVDWYRGDLP